MKQKNNLWIIAQDMAFDDIKKEKGFFTAQFKTLLTKKDRKIYDKKTKEYFNKLKKGFA